MSTERAHAWETAYSQECIRHDFENVSMAQVDRANLCRQAFLATAAREYGARMERLKKLAQPYLDDQVGALQKLRDERLDKDYRYRLHGYNLRRKQLLEDVTLSERDRTDRVDSFDHEILSDVQKPLRKARISFQTQTIARRGDDDHGNLFRRWMDIPWFFLFDKETRLTTIACTFMRLENNDASQLAMCSRLDLETGQISAVTFEEAVREPAALQAYADHAVGRKNAKLPVPKIPFYQMTAEEFSASQYEQAGKPCLEE